MKRLMVLALALSSLAGCYAGPYYGRPHYYRPYRQVYVAPRPVYAAPRPVYVAPRPYVAPAYVPPPAPVY